MTRENGSTLGVIALIIAIAGVGLSGYLTYSFALAPNTEGTTKATQARAYLSSPYGIDEYTWDTINFDEESYDPGNHFNLDSDM